MPNQLLMESGAVPQETSREVLQEAVSSSPTHEDAAAPTVAADSQSSSLKIEEEAKEPEPLQRTNLPEALEGSVAENNEVASSPETKTFISVARKATEVTEEIASPDVSDRIPRWSDIVIPYPFVRDDKDESIRKVKTPAARRMPAREQHLEANAAPCEFEINLNVEEEEWTIGDWRSLLSRRIEEAKKLDPASQPSDTAR
jgi:hypothetical protein